MVQTRRQVQNSIKRGKSFERQIAKMITTAFRNEGGIFAAIKDADVARTPMSGAWHEKGDLVKRTPLMKQAFPWCVECKNQKVAPDLNKLLVKVPAVFRGWWQQAVDQAELMEEYPLLIWRQSPKYPILCAMFNDDIEDLLVCSLNDFLEEVTQMDYDGDHYFEHLLHNIREHHNHIVLRDV